MDGIKDSFCFSKWFSGSGFKTRLFNGRTDVCARICGGRDVAGVEGDDVLGVGMECVTMLALSVPGSMFNDVGRSGDVERWS